MENTPINTVKRLNNAQYGMGLAIMAALKSEDPFTKVGACALSHDNRVISTGYNGLRPKFDLPERLWNDRDERRKYMIHAEVNCLSLCLRNEVRLLCVTMSPCLSCAQMISGYGVQEVVYGHIYHRDTAGLDLLESYGVKIVKIDIDSLVKEIASMTVKLFNHEHDGVCI